MARKFVVINQIWRRGNDMFLFWLFFFLSDVKFVLVRWSPGACSNFRSSWIVGTISRERNISKDLLGLANTLSAWIHASTMRDNEVSSVATSNIR